MRFPWTAITLVSVVYIVIAIGLMMAHAEEKKERQQQRQPDTFTVDGHTYVIDPPIRRQIPTPIRPLPDVPFDKNYEPKK